VAETLKALRRGVGDGRLVAVFEPRSYTSRTRVFQDEFAQALAGADLSIVAAAHLPAKVPSEQRVSERDLVRAIGETGGQGRFVETVDGIVAALASELRPGDHVVVLSNGGFGGIHDKLLAALGGPGPGG
ncbi:MAG TPA: UDP-N-acetylmuramate:L-alanyl-gamma-D-glutamyl-meso-diaminopimelate ligase, partial [Vicinamibacteria bacterium]|nr:UDP-N-acetylmuramate:L-alanyl-gamma-D-glutamyl-meso-diaminopimelate ligase [Vicinamibacteria bacterium]